MGILEQLGATEKDFREFLEDYIGGNSVSKALKDAELMDDNGVIYVKTERMYTPKTHPVISVDLDSTIWSEDYPNFGDIYPYAL